jgi:hypothetical protein
MALFEGERLAHWDLFKVPASRAPVERIVRMASGLLGVVEEVTKSKDPGGTTVIIETPGSQGRPHARGLITLGMAVGAVITAFDLAGYRVVTAKATEWTRLNGPRPKPKAVRAKLTEKLYPEHYSSDEDPTLDGADAVGLGAWFLGRFAEDESGEEGKS